MAIEGFSNEQIDQAYATAEQAANQFLAMGNTEAAHNNHLIMQQLVAQRDRNNAASASQATSGGPDPDAWAKAQADEVERRRKINAIESLRGLMNEYGLSSLMGKITEYVQQGYDADSVMVMIRTTAEYKQRFPAMEALAKKGRAISEGAYIEFERNAAQLERAYGLPEGMLNTETVTNLLTNEVSASELEDRVNMAAVGAYQTPPEVKQQFQEYYGISEGGLTGYFLDPEKAMPLLNKQYVSAQIGGAAAARSIDIGISMADRCLQEYGVLPKKRPDKDLVGWLKWAALTGGRGETVTQSAVDWLQTLWMITQAAQAIQRVGAARAGSRFQQGGQAITTQRGVTGAGTAATR
jgi:hypothetical protein